MSECTHSYGGSHEEGWKCEHCGDEQEWVPYYQTAEGREGQRRWDAAVQEEKASEIAGALVLDALKRNGFPRWEGQNVEDFIDAIGAEAEAWRSGLRLMVEAWRNRYVGMKAERKDGGGEK